MQKNNLHICLKNGAGYNLNDHYLALIYELLKRDIKITFLQENYGLSNSFFCLIKKLSKNNNFSFKLLDLPNGIKSHLKFADLLNSLKTKKINLIISTSDFTTLDRYLIKFATQQKIKVGVLQTCVLHQSLLKSYSIQRSNKKDIFPKKNIQLKKRNKNISSIIKVIINKIKNDLEKLFFQSKHNFFYPSLMGYGFFPINQNDRFNFSSGRADFVLCRSINELNILKNKIGGGSIYHNVKMPLLIKKVENKKTKKVLFIMSADDIELTKVEIENWVFIAEFLIKNLKIYEIDVRLHPRTSEELQWPNILERKLKQHKIKINMIKKNQSSISETAYQYDGFVSAFSGAIKVCKEQSNGFVSCVLNLSGRKNEESWMLGDSEEISIIQQGEELSKEMFIRKKTLKEGIPLTQLLINYCNLKEYS